MNTAMMSLVLDRVTQICVTVHRGKSDVFLIDFGRDEALAKQLNID